MAKTAASTGQPDLARMPSQGLRPPVPSDVIDPTEGDVLATDEAGARLVEAVEADDVGIAREPLGYFRHRRDIVALEEILQRNPGSRDAVGAVAHGSDARRKGVPREEHGPHGGAGEPVVVGEPGHPRVRGAQLLVEVGRAGVEEPFRSEAGGLEGPHRGAVAARPSAPGVLVRIDEEGKAVLAGLGGEALEVIQVFLVVNARAVMLDGFPRHEEAVELEAPTLEPREVSVGLLEREGPADEGDAPSLIEAFFTARVAVRPGRHLAVPAEVRAAQQEAPALFVFPMVAVNSH